MRFFILTAIAFLGACSDQSREVNHVDITDRSDKSGWTIQPETTLNSFFNCLDKNDLSIVSAHRGGPARGLPENALQTMLASLEKAPVLVEMDVATSRDGVLYLMHDDTLERTTNGSGLSNALNWSEIKNLRLTDNFGDLTQFHPTLFSEALAALKNRTIIQIDFKQSTRYEDVIAEVKKQRAEKSVIYIAYSLGSASKLHRLHPNAMISLNINDQDDLNAATSRGIEADRLLAFTGTRTTNANLYRQLEDKNIEIIFGTLGGRSSIDQQIARSGKTERYASLSKAGVDIIASDRPDVATKALKEKGRSLTSGICGVRFNK